nr:hypothetical transcript [Hymenolepis microstoma]
MVSSSTVLNRPQMPSVTVPVAQFLGRNASGSPVATTVSSQQQQQTATLQTVTNIISAYQANFQKQHAQTQVMTNMQKQGQSIVNLQKHQGQTGVLKQEEKPSSIIQTQTNTQKLEQQVQQTQRQQTQQQQRVTTCPENVRFATQVPSIIINRSHQQQLQATHTAQINAQTAGQQASINVSNNTRVAHSTAVLSRPQRGAWGNQVSHSPGSNTALLTNSLPTAQIIRPQSTQQRPLPHQQQQQMQAHSQQSAPQAQFQQFQQQQQFRAAVAGNLVPLKISPMRLIGILIEVVVNRSLGVEHDNEAFNLDILIDKTYKM